MLVDIGGVWGKGLELKGFGVRKDLDGKDWGLGVSQARERERKAKKRISIRRPEIGNRGMNGLELKGLKERKLDLEEVGLEGPR